MIDEYSLKIIILFVKKKKTSNLSIYLSRFSKRYSEIKTFLVSISHWIIGIIVDWMSVHFLLILLAGGRVQEIGYNFILRCLLYCIMYELFIYLFCIM